jgi:hypothetical protein
MNRMSNPMTHRPARVAALGATACLLFAAGCGPFWLWTGLVATGGSSSKAAPAPPELEVTSSADRRDLVDGSGAPSATEIRIVFRISDSTGATGTVDAAWRLASEADAAYRPASAAAGSDDVSALATSPDPGTPHQFVWAAGTDLAAAGFVEEDAVLRLTPRRGPVTGAAREVALRAGNRAPVVTIGSGGTLSRTAITSFSVADSSGDETTVTLLANGTPVQNLLVAPGAPTVLTSAPGGTAENFAWDTVAALGVQNLTADVTVVARDLFGAEGRASVSAQVVNDTPPTVEITAFGFPGKPIRGRVPLTVTVTDPDATIDPVGNGRVDLDVELSTDNGATFRPATLLGLGSGRFDAGESPRGRPVGVYPDIETGTTRLLWDAAADVGKTQPEADVPVALRVTPRNTLAGQPATAFGFVHDPVPDSDVFPITLPPWLPSNVFFAVTADFSGNGNADLAVVVGPPDTGIGAMGGNVLNGTDVEIFSGDGSGNFSFTNDITLGSSLNSIIGSLLTADFDGDGRPDLAVTTEPFQLSANETVVTHILLNQGGGQFTEVSSVASTGVLVALGDFNNDGIPDLVFCNDTANPLAVTVRLGLGGGLFGPPIVSTIDARDFGMFRATVIVDKDGRADLLVLVIPSERISNGVGNGDLFEVERGHGDGTFEVAFRGSIPAAPDFAGTVSFLQGLVAPGFDAAGALTAFEFPGAHLLYPIDLAGDGVQASLDYVSGSTSNVAIIRPRGSVSLDPLETLGEGGGGFLVTADVTGDGITDFVYGNSVFVGSGDGRYQPSTVTGALFPIALAPFTLGAVPDMLALSDQFALRVLRGLGDGTFTPLVDLPFLPTPFTVVGDFNGDGIPDLFVMDPSPVTLAGTGDGHFNEVFSTSNIAPPVFVADVTGDGIPDLIVSSNFAQILVLRGRGDGGFDEVPNAVTGPFEFGLHVAAVGDFTGDGIPDLLAFSGQGLSLLRGRGDGTFDFVAQSALPPGDQGGLVAVGDFLGTGALGIAVPSGGSSANDGVVDIIEPTRGARGPAARGEAPVALARQGYHALTGTGQAVIAALDATVDGIADLAFAELRVAQPGQPTPPRTVRILSASGVASRPLDLAGVPVPTGFLASDFRVTGGTPIDPAQGEPGLVATPTAGMRLAPASRPATVSPDRASFDADFLVTLPLSAELTGNELAQGVFHVYRYERDVQGVQFLPYRAPLVGRIVEIASTAPAPGFAAATVDPIAGTIRFPTRRLGTFQTFIEVPKGRVTLLRETFDAAPVPPDALAAPLPAGWSAGYTWQVGPPPTPTATPAGPDGPASFPNVLGTNLTGTGYRPNASDTVTTAPIVIGIPVTPSQGAPIVVSYREWVRLAPGDSISLEVVPTYQGFTAPPIAVVGAARVGPLASSGNGFIDAVNGPFDITSLLYYASSFQLRFTLTSGGAAGARGFYVDDIDVEMEP